MFQIVYSIGLALIILTALAVFYCVGHAYYHEFKETPRHKRSAKFFWYLVTVVFGIALIFTGHYFLQDSDYVHNLHGAWASFEGKMFSGPTDNISLEEWAEHYETEAEKTE